MSKMINEPQIRTSRVAILVYDDVTLLDVSGPLEVLHQTNRSTKRYETLLVSPTGGSVTTAAGLTLAGTITPAEVGRVDTVVIAGADHLAERVPDDVREAAEALQ